MKHSINLNIKEMKEQKFTIELTKEQIESITAFAILGVSYRETEIAESKEDHRKKIMQSQIRRVELTAADIWKQANDQPVK